MPVDTKGFRDTHDEVQEYTAELRSAAERFPSLSAEERTEAHGAIVRYLRERVEPHTRLDERLLYPEVAARVGDPLIAASMNYDHVAIRDWIEQLAAADVGATALVQQLLYGLDALIRVHLWKENALFLGTLESSSWPSGAW